MVTQRDFEGAIAPLVRRAEAVLDEALANLRRREGEGTGKGTGTGTGTGGGALVHEVVLVGGATRVPAVRDMLRARFPPPVPPELCCAIRPEHAVAEGAAIRAAVLSGRVPRHVLRNAMMLDALPHPIGVLVPARGDGGEAYIPILRKDTGLPAMGCADFYLADIDQPGVTIVAVEDVGEDHPLQRLGEFTFLLHRLGQEKKDSLGRRKVSVGMTVEESGKFIVSIFDEHDPEHVEKKRRYLKEKRRTDALAGAVDQGSDDEADAAEEPKGAEERFLTVAIVLLFFLYVGVRMAFAAPPGDGSSIF